MSRSTDSCQRTAPETWRTRASRQASPVVTTAASTLFTTGTPGRRRASERGRPASRSCAGFMSAQWKGADTGSLIARLAPLALQASMARSTARRVAGDHHLARGVDVGGRHHLALGGLRAGRLDGGEVQAQDGGHGSLPHRHRLLHVLPAAAHRGHRVAQAQRPRGHQGRVLAQAVPRHVGRPRRAPGLEGPQGRDAGGQDRGLGVGGELEVALGTLEAEPGKREPQGAVGLLENGAGLREGVAEALAHAHGLGALAREDEGDAHAGRFSSLRADRPRSSASMASFTSLLAKSAATLIPWRTA